MSGFAPAAGERDLYKIVTAIRQLFEGRSNAVGTCTLTANAASTTVTAKTCGASASQVFLFPTTAHAAAEIAAGGCYISAVANTSFTITHANNAQSDRTFSFVCLG
jgi:hypothetical protein